MVNRQPEGSGEQQWFPRLPNGYEEQGRHGTPGHGNQGFPPGHGSPGHGNQGFPPGHGPPGHGNQGFPPGHGPPGHGNQGFPPGHRPPGHGNQGFPPGHRPPGHGNQGFPPGHRPPGHGNQGFPPGHRPPGHGNQGFPPGHGSPGHQQAPTSPPPNMTPTYPSNQLYAIDPGAIAGCMYRYTYVWLSRRQGFWFYPTHVGRTSVSGYRWDSNRRQWAYYGVDLQRINSFTCY